MSSLSMAKSCGKVANEVSNGVIKALLSSHIFFILYSNICIQHKKVFIHEHTLFVESELGQHYREGEADDPSFKGHPECGFCMISFYGNDELYEHCREKHEQCFLCLRNGVRHQYHLNYSEMELHFREDHFPCMERECLEKKFVVFSSDIDLKAHQVLNIDPK